MNLSSLGIIAVIAAIGALDCLFPATCRSQTIDESKPVTERPLMVKVKRSVKDTEWKEYAARTVAMLPGYQSRATQIQYSKYGGWLSRRSRATGFFRVEKQGDRWWLVDPEGYLFIHVGVSSLAPGSTPTPQASLKEKYQTPERWAEQVTQWLWNAGFNGSGNWSSGPLLRTARKPLIYCANGPVDSPTAPPGTRAGFMNAFAKSKALTRPGVGHSNYPNDCMPLFHPEFEPFLDEYAKPLAALKNDPYLLGYFSDNELPMPRLDKYLALKPDDPEMGSSHRHAQAWLDRRKGKSATPADITDVDRDAWIEYAWGHYFAVTTRAIRKYDPNHLCLGPRLYGDEKRHEGAMRAAGRHLDVIGINHYFVWDPKPQDIARWTQWSGKPVMLTEWYAKGMDSGFPNTSGAGWTVPTQQDRGLFYQTFTLGLLESKNCVGWQWFKYMDNDQSDLKAEASNRDANKGMVTIKHEPYAPLLDHMRILNREVYALTDYFDGRPKIASATSAQQAPAAPQAQAAPQATTAPQTVVAPRPGIFAPTSFWYQPLPANAPLHPNSANFVSEFLRQKQAYYGTVSINTTSYASPVYVVGPDVAPVKVSEWDCQRKGFSDKRLAEQWQAVPIPAYAEPAAGTDAEMTIYQPSTDTIWEFWQARKVNGQWQACWGGRMQSASKSQGIWQNPYGTTATGLPFLGGQITAEELQRGEINHALGISLVDIEKWNIYSWPANRSDGHNPQNAPNRIPEGLRFRLDPTVKVDALKMHPLGKVIAKAAQKYGFVVWDKAGAITLRAQNPKSYTRVGRPDPYPALFNGTPAYAILSGFPWDKLQFLPHDWGKP